MREKIFRKLLDCLEIRTPGSLLCFQYQILTDLTARAFRAPVSGYGTWVRKKPLRPMPASARRP